MGVKERKTRQKKALRKKMLNAAAALLVSGGYENLSIRKIAAKIEYSPALLYHYFKDKADIVTNLINDSFEIFIKKTETFSDEVKQDPKLKVEAMLRTLIEVGLEYPNHYKAVFINYLETQKSNSHFAESPKREEGFVMLVNTIEEGIDKGIFKESDPISTAQVLWASVHGVILQLIGQSDMPEIKLKRIINTFIATILSGVKK